MGEDQWFQPTVRNRLEARAIVLANFTIHYGRFYDIKHPYNPTTSPQGTKILSKEQFEWGACGRQGSPSGTEGTFEVHLGSGEKIAEIYWDCPYVGSNKLEKKYVKSGYVISFNGFSIPSGALGKGTISVLKD